MSLEKMVIPVVQSGTLLETFEAQMAESALRQNTPHSNSEFINEQGTPRQIGVKPSGTSRSTK
jgi:hypothetical protein